MYTKTDLMDCLEQMKIDPMGTVLVHSSMKAIGPVAGGADTVLDAFQEYMRHGLLVFPTHTWATVNSKRPVMNVLSEPACIGLLPNLFMKRSGVVRSLHPTHSAAAWGREAQDFVKGEQASTTPCARHGCWGKLVDRDAQIIFLGCGTCCNTLLHGTEEWENVPNRLRENPVHYTVVDANGTRHDVIQYGHNDTHPSQYYDSMEPIFIKRGAMHYGTFGDAHCAIGSARRMNDITAGYLKINPDLFSQHGVRRLAEYT